MYSAFLKVSGRAGAYDGGHLPCTLGNTKSFNFAESSLVALSYKMI